MQGLFYDPDRCTASGRITDQRDTDCQLDRHGADHGNMLLADQRTEGTEYFKKQAAANGSWRLRISLYWEIWEKSSGT